MCSCCVNGLAGREVRPLDLNPRVRREGSARLLSSYNNNSNNPLRGTDRLRGAS
jgi:hypothetical protein